MEIFGLSSVEITLIICIVGIVTRIYVGKIKHSETKFSINAAILSFMVGILVSVGLVAPVIDAIPDNTTAIVILPVLTGQVIIVMKSESISTAAQKLIHKNPSEIKNGP